jgi:hemerythrin-like domain-containing protein
MSDLIQNRREFFKGGAAGVGGAFLFLACGGSQANSNSNSSNTSQKGEDDKDNPNKIEVTAVEDLMREHGILRRALLVYAEAAMTLRKNAADVSPEALQKTAKLFRTFGEEYHEKKLEEAFIFPRIKEKGSGPATTYPDILTAQHERGRQITDHIISVTGSAKIGAEAAAFADTLDSFVRMYQHHAAREDTIVFPAWKGLLSAGEYDDLNDTFEDIEHDQFGEDGFEDAAKQMGEIEETFGLSDISKLTPPPPPGAK